MYHQSAGGFNTLTGAFLWQISVRHFFVLNHHRPVLFPKPNAFTKQPFAHEHRLMTLLLRTYAQTVHFFTQMRHSFAHLLHSFNLTQYYFAHLQHFFAHLLHSFAYVLQSFA